MGKKSSLPWRERRRCSGLLLPGRLPIRLDDEFFVVSVAEKAATMIDDDLVGHIATIFNAITSYCKPL
ncbi:hypothetical protein IVB33_25370 [Bradyrhizobium sp. 24]|nr:hypothetical protein [Bradyrhizobium sp. 24]